MFEKRWLMFDIARQRTFNKHEMIILLNALQKLGYNGLGIYIEGAFAFENIPGVIREGVLTPDDAKWIKSEASSRGIKVFPMTNVVGHMEHFFSQERFHNLLAKDTTNQLDFFQPEAESFVMGIVHEYIECFETDLMHIGGDETHLTPETKIKYSEFLAKICDNLLAEGITPAIWDDMIWMTPELTDVFSRDVFIFDWNYYGHRPESVLFYKEKGFKNIIVCPCENSWEGFINFQRISGYLKASLDITVKPDEIEAFFVDAKENGIDNGMLTTWNNETGRDIWAQFVPIARSALYMNGKYEPSTRDDTKIEMALFGRVTPYTKVTYMIQDSIQVCGDDVTYCQLMRNALYIPERLLELLNQAPKYKEKLIERYEKVMPKIEAELNTWIPQNELEERCCTAMRAVSATIKASFEIIKAGAMRVLYSQAADLQFKSPLVCKQLLAEIEGGFNSTNASVFTLRNVFASAIENTGHTVNDLKRLEKTTSILTSISHSISSASENANRIPLPLWEILLSQNFEV